VVKRITMAHGAGGYVMQNLIQDYILKHLGGSQVEVPLEAFDDAAVVDNIVLKSDSHTVKPLFFPGGDIGRLAVAGTVNDIAVMGAEPLALSCGIILAEGFPIAYLERILQSMGKTCRECGVDVITGDTKVVEKESLEDCIINTSGIGRRSEVLEENLRVVREYRKLSPRWILDSNLMQGDKIIVSGTIGDHGIAVLSSREGYGFGSSILSDVMPLNGMIYQAMRVGGIVAMKDPTRGGLSNALNEWSSKSRVGLIIDESTVPIREDVKAACEMLGIDPLDIGNEGKVILGVVAEKALEVLDAIRSTKEGEKAELIGEATGDFREVALRTLVGGRRILSPPIGDPVPRIC
jgi:hydrogenase expression/formation protein HypE